MEEDLEVNYDGICPDLIGANVEMSTPITNFATDEEVDERLINDTNHLITILPEDLWRTIMDVHTDPQILENFCNASLFFRNILDTKRSQFLFPKVWEILEADFTVITENEYHQIKKDVGSENFERKYGVKCISCGLTRYPRRFSSILNLRLVCKSWCAGIDAFNQNHPRHFRMEAEAAYGYDDTFYLDNMCFEWGDNSFERDSERFEKFLKHFGDTHGSPEDKRNPFLSRSVEFDMYNYGNDNPIIPGFQSEVTVVTKFLRKYGHHIWYCNLSWNVSILEFPVIRVWLILMPNLKVLKLVGIDLFRTNANFRQELAEWLESRPNFCTLPHFPDLQFLNAYDLPQIILEGLLRENSNITKLLVDKENRLNLYDFNGIQLPSLKHLCHKFNTEEEFQIFQISTVNWPLTDAYLSFMKNISIQWTSLFAFLHGWGSTLENLKIFIANKIPITQEDFNPESNINMDLKFPNLKKLKLIMYYFTSLDFLLVMKDTLEILDIYVIYKHEENVEKSIASDEAIQNQTVQFLGYQERLLESNIWQLFPRLKRVLIFECHQIADWDHREVRQSWVYNRVNVENVYE